MTMLYLGLLCLPDPKSQHLQLLKPKSNEVYLTLLQWNGHEAQLTTGGAPSWGACGCTTVARWWTLQRRF